jgi:phage shock protein PspC (stress-responsive transcriptional regulator)
VFSGVCGGLGEYFDIDPVLVRVVFVICTVFGGFGIFAYIVLWIVTPTESRIQNISTESNSMGQTVNSVEVESTFVRRRQAKKLFLGSLMIIIGSLWFLDNVFGGFDLHRFWPLLLILAGIFILYKSSLFTSKHREAV